MVTTIVESAKQSLYMIHQKILFIFLKDVIIKNITRSRVHEQKIGGLGSKIQVDETTICSVRLIANPSNECDNQPGIQWITGDVEKDKSRNFF